MSALLDPRLWSRRTRVRVVGCLLVALAAAAAGEFMARRDAEAARSRAGESLQLTVQQLAEQLSQEMAARVRDVNALVELDSLRALDAPADARAVLENARRSLPVFAWFGLLDLNGQVVAATDDILVGQSIAQRPVFQNGLKGLWVGDVHEAQLLAKLVPHASDEPVKFVDVAAPVRGPDGQPRFVLALHLSWQWADLLRQSVLRPRSAPRSLQLMVVDATGELLLPPEKGVVETGLTDARLDALEGRWSVETWRDGRDALTSVSESRALGDFPGFGWRVVARDPQAAAATSLQSARPEAYAWAFGMGAAFALLLCWAAGHLVPTRPPRPPRSGGGWSASGGPRSHRRSDAPAASGGGPRASVVTRDAPPTTVPSVLSAQRDPLTGLWDRSFLAELTERLAATPEVEASESPEGGSSASAAGPADEYCVLSIDLDHFESVNERYGPAAADQVLAQVARRLRHVGREEDWVFRLEGDHFLVMLRCPAGEGTTLTRNVAHRVLHELQRPMSYRTLSNLRVTASLGGAVWRPAAGTVEEALARADVALQAAQHSGQGLFRQHAGGPAGEAAASPSPDTRLRA